MIIQTSVRKLRALTRETAVRCPRATRAWRAGGPFQPDFGQEDRHGRRGPEKSGSNPPLSSVRYIGEAQIGFYHRSVLSHASFSWGLILRALLAAAIIFLPTSVLAQSVDCNAVLQSRTPFQLELKSSENKPSVVQITRFDHLVRTLAEHHEGSPINRSTYQANFIRSISRPNGKSATVTWDVPTDKFFWDAKIYYAEGSFSDGQKLAISFRLIDDAPLKVGPCVFQTKHFVSIGIYLISSRTTTIESEVWFSPGLQAPLKLSTKVKSDKGEKVSGSEAIGITTSFTPLN